MPKSLSKPHTDMFRSIVDLFDGGVFVLSADLAQLVYANPRAAGLLSTWPAPELVEPLRSYVRTRDQTGAPPPALRVVIDDKAYFLRASHAAGPPPVEVVFIRAEQVRGADEFRFLNSRFRVNRRAYEVLVALRQGKTNKQIALELGLTEGTVAQYVHRLLDRFDAPNRAGLVDIVQKLVRSA